MGKKKIDVTALRQKIAEHEQHIREHHQAINAIKDKVDAVEIIPEIKKLIGTCYRVRNNYSCPEKPSDYWWLYRKLLSHDGKTVATLDFQTDKYGAVEIKNDRRYVYHSTEDLFGSGWIRIGEAEFNREYRDALKRITDPKFKE